MDNVSFIKKGCIDQYLPDLWESLKIKVDQMIVQMGEKSPHVSACGVYDDMRLDWWTSGFWSGILWILFDRTGDDRYKKAAWSWDERIEQCFLKENNFHHDVGFQFLPTAVIKYKLTGDEDARRRGLFAANFLAGRFNIAGKFLRAWNQDKTGWSIIDSSMNLSLLFWASEEIKDPRFKHIAKAHADTVVKHFIRQDGSVCHIAVFDAESGDFIESLGGQGYGPDSAWSRGQAWALYGMANTYRYTKDVRYLKAAQRVAEYFIASLPENGVPYWDFRMESFENEPRDTSAASCAASGLIEIASQLPKEEGKFYLDTAKRMIDSLTKNYSTLDKPEYEGLLLGATGHKPAGQNINVSLIYGDYFYVEAVAKLSGWQHTIF